MLTVFVFFVRGHGQVCQLASQSVGGSIGDEIFIGVTYMCFCVRSSSSLLSLSPLTQTLCRLRVNSDFEPSLIFFSERLNARTILWS